MTLAQITGINAGGVIKPDQSLLDAVFAGAVGTVLGLDQDKDQHYLPDIDVDGDGLETFWQANPPTAPASAHVDTCRTATARSSYGHRLPAGQGRQGQLSLRRRPVGGPEVHRGTRQAGRRRSLIRGDRVATDVKAHITGTVWKIEAKPGSKVSEGDTVIILESMKMEMPVEAPCAGTVREVEDQGRRGGRRGQGPRDHRRGVAPGLQLRRRLAGGAALVVAARLQDEGPRLRLQDAVGLVEIVEELLVGHDAADGALAALDAGDERAHVGGDARAGGDGAARGGEAPDDARAPVVVEEGGGGVDARRARGRVDRRARQLGSGAIGDGGEIARGGAHARDGVCVLAATRASAPPAAKAAPA